MNFEQDIHSPALSSFLFIGFTSIFTLLKNKPKKVIQQVNEYNKHVVPNKVGGGEEILMSWIYDIIT
jgi:hypothetical protein